MKKLKYLLIILLLTGCKFYDEYKMPEDVTISLNENKFEVYSDKVVNDLISDKNVEILNSNKELITTSIGKKTIEIEYKYKKRNYKYVVNYDIVDTEKPIILRSENYKSTNVNEEIDLCEDVIMIDNYDRTPKCSINGDYDITKAGTYNLKYQVSDDSGNITEDDLTFTIIDQTIVEDNNDYYKEDNNDDEDDTEYEYSYTLFDDLEEKYKTKDTMLGIDVSAWQGEIDFNKVKEDGCEFVIIRMAYNLEDDKEIYLDKYFEENLKNAKKTGLKVGVYVYTNASTKEEATSQAKFIKKKLNKTKLDFPIAYDFENWSNFNSYKMNSHDLISRVDEFESVLKEDGYEVMIYGSKNYLEKAWLPNDHITWLAHYIDLNNYTNTDYSREFKIWQIASDGIIDGIEGYVDFDIYYK